MADIKVNNGKYIFGETEFKATNGDPDNADQYLAVKHDATDGVFGVGVGFDKNNYSIPLVLADDGYFDIPAGTAGYGFILVGDADEWAKFSWADDNTVTLLDNSTNVVAADTDGNLAIFDNTTSVRIRNRLGSAKRVLFEYVYTTP